MKSSCTSALACSSSRAAQARTSAVSSATLGLDRAEAPVAERRPEPLAAADRGAGLRDQSRGVGAEGREAGGLLVEEVVEHAPGRDRGRRPDPSSSLTRGA